MIKRERKSSASIMLGRGIAAFVAAAIVTIAMLAATGAARAETRTLKLYFTHTKERAEITYKRNGRFLPDGLRQVNHMLRDWRRNEPTNMDPRVVDLLWQVYRASGSRDYIHIVSAYRSPATNSMLRSRSSGVAKNSQHTLGKAIDFFLPDVPVARLRALGLQAHGGGVGYYPNSGSPFVHLDVGSVRHWPRMNRSQLLAVFPNGGTIHVPSDGKPLPGYEQAVAAYQARQRNGGEVQMASAGGSSGGGRGLLATLFGGGNNAADEEEETGTPVRASAPAPAPARDVAPPAAVREAPRTPETIIAALPARDIPLPTFAPRPQADVGPVAAPEAPVAVAAAVPESLPFEVRPAEQPTAVEAAAAEIASVPVPTWRPQLESEIAAVKTPDVAEARPVELASASPALPDELSVAALIGNRPSSTGSNAIESLLAAQAQPASEPGVPAVREGANGEMMVLASLPDPSAATSLVDAEERATTVTLKERAIAATQDSRVGPLPADASPRVAMVSREEGTSARAALDAGVRTTTKGARTQAGQARSGRQPVAVPIADDNARWVFEAGSVSTMTAGTRAPSFAHEIVRTAPDAVYTAGFQQDSPQQNAQRFTGRAVQFMSVARFN